MKDEERKFKILPLNSFYLSFMILGSGCGISIAVFLVELLIGKIFTLLYGNHYGNESIGSNQESNPTGNSSDSAVSPEVLNEVEISG